MTRYARSRCECTPGARRRTSASARPAIVVGAALALAAALSAPPPAAADPGGPTSSLFKVDAARTGHLPEGPQPPLELRWKFKTRKGKAEIERYPTVDDGLSPAIVSGGRVYVGGHDGWVYAVDARSGEKLWEFQTRDHVMTTPTLHEGRLYVGSMDGFLYALDAASGALLWKYESGYKIWNGLPYGGIRATPIVVGGKLVFGG